MQLDWDSAKNDENLEKHGISFEEASSLRSSMSLTRTKRIDMSLSGRLSAASLSWSSRSVTMRRFAS